jgi:hypothetical protein
MINGAACGSNGFFLAHRSGRRGLDFGSLEKFTIVRIAIRGKGGSGKTTIAAPWLRAPGGDESEVEAAVGEAVRPVRETL